MPYDVQFFKHVHWSTSYFKFIRLSLQKVETYFTVAYRRKNGMNDRQLDTRQNTITIGELDIKIKAELHS